MKQLHGGTSVSGKPAKTSAPDKPLVSIITVCLNSEKYLEQTIQSVLGQTYDNIEYIIIDGGSTDKTLDIIRKYEERIEYWVSEPDRGIYAAMNKGISFSRGEWVGIINSDDFYAKDTVRLVVEAARSDKEAQLFCGNIKILNSREFKDRRDCWERKGQIGNFLLKKLKICHPTCFVSRKIYAKFKFNTNFMFAADSDFVVRLYANNVKFGYINEPLAYARPGGIGSSLPARCESYQIKTFYKTFPPRLTRAALKKSLETGRPSLPFFVLFLVNTLQIFPILCSIMENTVKLIMANINPKLTRHNANKHRWKLNFGVFQLKYRLFRVFFYRYGK